MRKGGGGVEESLGGAGPGGGGWSPWAGGGPPYLRHLGNRSPLAARLRLTGRVAAQCSHPRAAGPGLTRCRNQTMWGARLALPALVLAACCELGEGCPAAGGGSGGQGEAESREVRAWGAGTDGYQQRGACGPGRVRTGTAGGTVQGWDWQGGWCPVRGMALHRGHGHQGWALRWGRRARSE